MPVWQLPSKVYVCLDPLPTSIEAYLEEAGFSGTEIIVLKKLLEEDALTLRELASKTGKSTGVLDQAVKKLLSKKILSRESINDTPKYVLTSLDSVLAWLEEDVRTRQQMIVRKHENFEMYVRTLSNGKRRPDMEHFEGADNIKKAYNKLLERGNDIIQYGPTLYLVDEDPLRDFRIQYFRDRRTRGLFSRVITHNTPMGRRFQSRDAFEYRKTILVEKEDYPFTFEKIIVGDTVACFQLEENIACFIKYPELAQEERLFFERLWNKNIESQRVSEETIEQVEVFEKKTCVPLTVKTASRLRDFFLSPKSLVAFGVCALLAAGVTWGLYAYNMHHTIERVKDKTLSIAVTGALQFDVQDLNEIRTHEDIAKPQYGKILNLLNKIRSENDGIAYAYLLRPGELDSEVSTYIADADSLDTSVQRDINEDGKIDEKDQYVLPGDIADDTGSVPPSFTAYQKPTAFEVYYDPQWGIDVFSGWAPIKDDAGNTVAVFGIDIFLHEALELSENTFNPVLIFAILFVVFVVIRLAAFDRSMLKEVIEVLKTKKTLLLLVAGAIIAAVISLSLYYYHVQLNIEGIKERIVSIAATGALQFSADDLNQIHTLKDIKTEAYSRVMEALDKIRSQNADIKYTYIIRPKDNSSIFEFIADADSLGMKPGDEKDINRDGVINDSDEAAFPGLQYDITNIGPLIRGEYFSPTVTDVPYTDKWGSVYTGYAPIKTQVGSIAGILAIDVDVEEAYKIQYSVFIPIAVYVLGLLIYLLFAVPGFKETPLSEIVRWMLSRRILTITVFVLMGSYWITFGLYFYTLHLKREEIGKRLMAIAVTAASQINPDDLEPLRFAGDMKREEYQRVFGQLNDIRDKNPEMTYIYVLRPTETYGIWEFVADADSNYNLPFLGFDFDQNGIVNEGDENVAPGVRYDLQYTAPKLSKYGLEMPTFEMCIQDQWGTTINGSAPILKNGKGIANLSIDMFVSELLNEGKIKFIKILLILQIISLILICLRLGIKYKS